MRYPTIDEIMSGALDRPPSRNRVIDRDGRWNVWRDETTGETWTVCPQCETVIDLHGATSLDFDITHEHERLYCAGDRVSSVHAYADMFGYY